MKESKVDKVMIKKGNTSEDIWYIADLDTRNPDRNPDQYLHKKPRERRNGDSTFSDGVQVIEEAYECDDAPEDEDDVESMFECHWYIERVGESNRHDEERHHDSNTDPIGNRLSAMFSFIKVGTIENCIVFPYSLNGQQYTISDDRRGDEVEDECSEEGHG